MATEFDWLKPSPFWRADGTDIRQGDLLRPRLLKFQTDRFMDDFFAAAGAPSPADLSAYIEDSPADGSSLRLFQPAHQTYYLVCGSLCCREPGFPDRVVQRADGESVFFVLRKQKNGTEYGWVPGSPSNLWTPVDTPAAGTLDKEERLPLMTTAASNGKALLFGYVPVASRETYAAAPSEFQADPSEDVRIEELGSRFTAALDSNNPSGKSIIDAINPQEPGQDRAALGLTMSVYLLVDLWEYLLQPQILPDVAAALRDNPNATFTGDKAAQKQDLMNFLLGQSIGGSKSLAAALNAVSQPATYNALNAEGGADPASLGLSNADFNLQNLTNNGVTFDAVGLKAKVGAALPDQQPSVDLPKLGVGDTYLLRLVYDRPQCDPPQQYVSQPSAPFQLAPFFDADAPARPIRITLPTDVSMAGFRKLKKGVAFMMSDAMNTKMNSVLGHEAGMLKDPPQPGQEVDLGIAFICSFSIQIIFVVAFFLLLIFVFVLNIVFWWIAFFKICFPVPKALLQK